MSCDRQFEKTIVKQKETSCYQSETPTPRESDEMFLEESTKMLLAIIVSRSDSSNSFQTLNFFWTRFPMKMQIGM